MIKTLSSVGLLLSFLTPFFSHADEAAQKGLEVAQKVDRHDKGFDSQKAELKMTLTNRQGQTSERFIRSRTLEVEGDGDKSLVIFDRPRDVKGTAFLSFTHKTGNDDQWLYLPALKRVKRISSNNKAGPFMGSEFAYEDLSSQEVEKYTYRLLKEATCPTVKEPCWLVEFTPVDKKSGYTKQNVWINQTKLRFEKIDFFDRKDALLKTLIYEGYKQYLGRYWRAQKMTMQNHQNGKKTVLEWSKYQFQTGLTARDFDKNSLKRAR